MTFIDSDISLWRRDWTDWYLIKPLLIIYEWMSNVEAVSILMMTLIL
jgi:hypothetical protein